MVTDTLRTAAKRSMRALTITLAMMALGLWACGGGGGADDGGDGGPGPNPTCESGCDTPGARLCQEGGVATCGDADGDGCPEWSAPESCGDLACVDGQCIQQCEGEDCVQDLPPEAAFSFVMSGDRQVTVNASGTTDDTTPPEDLRFRWDWENDGLWDTELEAKRTAQHTYDGQDATFTIALEVRDQAGQSATVTRTVTLEEVEQVEGNVPTTTWTGNVVLTDDAVVGTDDTLTIEAGTVVAFVQRDTDADGVGDLGLDIHGTLLVKGTPEAPVVFTAIASGDEDPAASAWHQVLLARGSRGHDIRNVMIEFADVGLQIQSSADVTNLRVHNSRTGVHVGSDAGEVLLDNAHMFANAGDGALVTGGMVQAPGLVTSRNGGRGLALLGGDGHVATGCIADLNGRHGVEVAASSVDLSGCGLYENAEVGLVLRGDARGTLQDGLVTENGMEGVRALAATSGDPSMVIHESNVTQNGSTGNLTLAETDLEATDAAPAAAWSAPGGGAILMAEVSLTPSGAGAVPTGRLLDGQGQLVAEVAGATDHAWIPLTEETASLRAEVKDGAGTLTVHRVAHEGPADGRELVAILSGGTLDARWNWWGSWPAVLEAVTLAHPADVDLQGFTGVPFADALDTSRFVGGVTLTGDTTWSGSDVYITGDVALAAGATLTIEPGVTVSIVPVDQDGDGLGDYVLDRADGDLVAEATLEEPVKILALSADNTSLDGHSGVAGNGDGTTTFEHVWISNGRRGIHATGGDVVLRSVVLQFHSEAGLHTAGDATLDVDGTLVRQVSGQGVLVEASGAALLRSVTCEAIGGWCTTFDGATHADNLVERSDLVDSAEGGLRVRDSVAAVDHNDIQDNAWGLWIDGTSEVTVTANEIMNNSREGVVVAMYAGGEPDATLTGNNIFANGTQQSFTREEVTRQAASGESETGDAVGAALGAPDGGVICFVHASYSETGSAAGMEDVSGALETPGGEEALVFEDTAAAGWFHVAHDPDELIPVVRDASPEAGATLDVSSLVREVPVPAAATPIQMTVHLLETQVDAGGNYWGGPADGRVQAFQSGTVDTSGALETAQPDAGPNG